MSFLQLSMPTRTMKNQRPAGASVETVGKMHCQTRYMVRDTDSAVGAHKRPSTSHVMERRKRSLTANSTGARAVKEQPPTCPDDPQKPWNVVEYQDGLDTFKFPTPSYPPMSSMPRSASAATFRQSPSQLQYESAPIGVALGSPTDALPDWGRSLIADHKSFRMPSKPPRHAPPSPPLVPPPPPPTEPLAAANSSADARRRKSSWKTFRTVFSRTAKSDAQVPRLSEISRPYIEVDDARPPPPTASEIAGSEVFSFDLPRHSYNEKRHARLHSASSWRPILPPVGGPRVEGSSPGSQPAYLMPGKLPSPLGSVTPETRIHSGWEWPLPRKMDDTRHDSAISHASQHSPPPKLEVNFEKPEFERYSVMFEKLLSTESQPSLLERRQSRVQRRKSGKMIGHIKTGERLETVAQSPMIFKGTTTSPGLSERLPVKPESDKGHDVGDRGPPTAVHRPWHLQRASTAPLSAVTTVFANSRKANRDSSPESDESALFSESSSPSTPATVGTCTDADSPIRELRKPESALGMLTPNHSHNTMTEYTQSSVQYPNVKSREDLERQIVQVSVARQVSVSQAKMAVQRAVSSNNYKQPTRPRVVELSKNRYSEVGLLESMCEDDAAPIPSREPSKRRGSSSPNPLMMHPPSPSPMVATFAPAVEN